MYNSQWDMCGVKSGPYVYSAVVVVVVRPLARSLLD